MPTPARPQQVAGALLLHSTRKVLLHHRDDIPGISNPGKWALFGGHIEAGESPEAALVRELHEELGLQVTDPQLFVRLHGAKTKYFMYLVEVRAAKEALNLTEGQGMDYFTPEDALETLDLSTTARTVLNMFLEYEKFREAETGSRHALQGASSLADFSHR